MGEQVGNQIEVKYGDKTAKLKVHRSNNSSDLAAILHTRFGLPSSAKIVITDRDGFDVVLDPSLPTGTYTLNVLSSSTP